VNFSLRFFSGVVAVGGGKVTPDRGNTEFFELICWRLFGAPDLKPKIRRERNIVSFKRQT